MTDGILFLKIEIYIFYIICGETKELPKVFGKYAD